ncbi:hypothetical protein SBRCBS47491_001669 [Sporothrix bragantina]|uniref:Protein kinase domain-containing protein n=1 Tax=Sporothrix bragantina TaxID=671064 RepID=A0ABP0B0K0_9PEZI
MDVERRLRRRHDSLPMHLRARWALEAVHGVMLLHANGIIHCDIWPQNVGLDASLGVRIMDFGGSALGDLKPLLMENSRFSMPGASWEDYGVVTDCYALGSSLYETVTGFQPYETLGYTNDDGIEAQTIRKCWHGKFATAADVLASLKLEAIETFDEENVKWIEEASGVPLGPVVKDVNVVVVKSHL